MMRISPEGIANARETYAEGRAAQMEAVEREAAEDRALHEADDDRLPLELLDAAIAATREAAAETEDPLAWELALDGLQSQRQKIVTATNALPIAPGETLREWLEGKDITALDLARRIGCLLKVVEGVLAGDTPITEVFAARLDDATGIPVTFWLERERRYRDEA